MEVEVVFPEICGAFYKANVLDIDTNAGKCLVTFENGWKPNCWIELQYVRHPPKQLEELDLTPGSKVEAYLPFKDGEPQGWWLATVTKSKGEVVSIQFGGDQQYTDLVEHNSLRMPNQSPPLSEVQFYQKEFPSPIEMQDFCRDPKVHHNFRTKIKALSVTYDSEKTSLLVLADNHECINKAEILIDMHFSDLSTQATLRSRTERAAQRLQQPIETHVLQETPGVIEEKFYIHSECIGFAMGKQGWNVNEARGIPGVVSIEFDDYSSMFTIRAETREAAIDARELLEFTREIMLIPRDLAGKVIGRGGNIVQQVLDKSRLNNIKVIGDEEATERKINAKGQVPFELLGRKKAIENAKLMLDYHLDHLREINTILQDREEISRKLRDSGIDDPPTLYPRPNPPRGGRGRGWGRGRGRPRRDNIRRDEPRENERREEEEQEEQEQEGEEEKVEENQDYSNNDSESSEEEQQIQERVDSPATENQISSSPPDRRRRQRGKRRYQNERRNNPPNDRQTDDTSEDAEEWPLPNAQPTTNT